MTKKGKQKSKHVISFIVYIIIFTAVTAPFYVFKGPFNSLKNVVVGTIMGTRHQYLATTFLSKTDIDKITNKSSIKENTKVSIANINISNNANSIYIPVHDTDATTTPV